MTHLHVLYQLILYYIYLYGCLLKYIYLFTGLECKGNNVPHQYLGNIYSIFIYSIWRVDMHKHILVQCNVLLQFTSPTALENLLYIVMDQFQLVRWAKQLPAGPRNSFSSYSNYVFYDDRCFLVNGTMHVYNTLIHLYLLHYKLWIEGNKI